ncbi:MAG: SDR family oxidoreductase [Bacteroidales bacterium]|nr:SDR family oxidoreductase [Bacteroidales bacterium]MCF8344207.1 SDR family oxidoreductase [Bacteroidales bacterium]MCF8352692.1 SDR family oxidoreductase [Bacteroidales bacterium]MCF8375078.1 SDR family oxidoreductase [Bacteroidales bacterium]MCF8399984.1 SDR family oxidoreductase [Bacteroidales bacterium]
MKILLTGATGYIGKRLLPVLLEKGHEVICCVRDRNRFNPGLPSTDKLKVIELNFLENESLDVIPRDIVAAYYLIHSMSAKKEDFESLESASARNFRDAIDNTKARQVVYLSGIVNEEKLSKHLRSRKKVEDILASGNYKLTTLRAGIIVGSGSASFEIVRDLVEKLPLMVAPRWLNTKSHPIAIRNVLEFLTGVLMREETFGKNFDIGGPEILTYKQMLMRFAKVRKLKRTIITLPVMTPRLSSYWLYFVTSTSYKLAVNLVNSMKVEVVGKSNKLHETVNINLLTYEQAVRNAFDKIEQQDVLSSWTDAQSSKILEKGVSSLIEVPTYGCFKDKRERKLSNAEQSLEKIWKIGGENGWYYANWLWRTRGFLDKMVGGVGLRRGRTTTKEIHAGDALDFWRVLYANRQERRLLLYAEMRLPGEAWLEFSIQDDKLYQIATFRPRGLGGRLYWFFVMPFHGFVFKGMINKIAN